MPLPLPARVVGACLATALAAALAAATAVPAAGATSRQPDRRPVAASRTSAEVEAHATLAEAKALFAARATSGSQRRAASAPARDATMVLTRLAHSLGHLSAGDREAARRILARPGYGGTPGDQLEHAYSVPEAQPLCDTDVCIHYVTSSGDKVSPSSDDGDGISDYVQQVRSVMAHVWATEITQMGYSKPLDDSGVPEHGPDGRLDVYLQDLPAGLYGYCAPDTSAEHSSGYCVLDNDYLTSEFPQHTPTENLEITAAHEFFHAVQFGYDSGEDPWFMEGTAAWMEDEVYTDVNDNRQYLAQSPLSDPYLALDYVYYAQSSTEQSYLPYGSWIFWRFLSEWTGPGAADDASIVRQVWWRARSTYSTRALTQVLAAHHLGFGRTLLTFGTWNRDPARYYREGAGYPTAPLDGKYTLTSRSRSTGARRDTGLSHTSHAYLRFIPSSTLTGTWRLRVAVNMPDTVRGSIARLSVHRPSGAVAFFPVTLSRTGAGTATVGFTRSKVAFVELDLANDSTRFVCDQGTDWSCGGVSRDDDLDSAFSATAVR